MRYLKFRGVRWGGVEISLDLIYQKYPRFWSGFAASDRKFILYSGTKNHGRTLFVIEMALNCIRICIILGRMEREARLAP
ncbi:hypothetical protein ASE23_08015 [Rhizobium sp. Root73]|nr:hypothetical protein ASE23_08015 [Rhizobium sp. Root73]